MTNNASYHVKGFVDLLDENRIQGWFLCEEFLHKRARISVSLNNREIASGIADISRPDLISVGIGVDNFSFAIRFSTPLDQNNFSDLRVHALILDENYSTLQFEVNYLTEIKKKLINKKNACVNKKIKTIYYLTAPTSSGKTTTAKRLSQELNLPIFHADLVYDMLCDRYQLSCPPATLIDPVLWNDPKNFGITSWGKYANIDDAKLELYEELLRSVDGDFIIEGFTLSLPSERAIISKVVGLHKAIVLRITLPFSQWREMYNKKNGFQVSDLHSSRYEYLHSMFSDCGAFKTAEYSHPDQISAFSVKNIPMPKGQKRLELISEKEYIALGRELLEKNPLDNDGNYVGYWKDLESRWIYHKRVVGIIKQYGKSSTSALELGSMGLSVVRNGHTIDYDKHFSYYPNLQPHYVHDVRNLPWPIPDKYYDWFIALRVFHHLAPVQQQCFYEAQRIAKNIILVVPNELPPGGGTPIIPEDFLSWGGGLSPTIVEDVGRFGVLYAWLDI